MVCPRGAIRIRAPGMRLLRRSGGGEQVEVGEGGSQGRRVDEVEGLEAGGACPCDGGLAVVDEEGLRRPQAGARRDYLAYLRRTAEGRVGQVWGVVCQSRGEPSI